MPAFSRLLRSSALATAERTSFASGVANAFGGEIEDRERLLDALAADLVRDEARLARADPRVAELGSDCHDYFAAAGVDLLSCPSRGR